MSVPPPTFPEKSEVYLSQRGRRHFGNGSAGYLGGGEVGELIPLRQVGQK
jgi:hypothetical protein